MNKIGIIVVGMLLLGTVSCSVHKKSTGNVDTVDVTSQTTEPEKKGYSMSNKLDGKVVKPSNKPQAIMTKKGPIEKNEIIRGKVQVKK